MHLLRSHCSDSDIHYSWMADMIDAFAKQYLFSFLHKCVAFFVAFLTSYVVLKIPYSDTLTIMGLYFLIFFGLFPFFLLCIDNALLIKKSPLFLFYALL